jgi:hypothetical protein
LSDTIPASFARSGAAGWVAVPAALASSVLVTAGVLGFVSGFLIERPILGLVLLAVLVATIVVPVWMAGAVVARIVLGRDGARVAARYARVAVERRAAGTTGLAQRVIAVAGAAFLLVVVCEGAARLVVFVQKDPIGSLAARAEGDRRVVTFVEDAAAAYRLKPRSTVVYPGEWGTTRFDLNETGFRGVDVPVTKEQGEFRVAIVGDSFVAAFEIPRFEDTLGPRLERALGDGGIAGAGRTRALMFGTPGDGTDNELRRYTSLVRRWRADVVLVVFYVDNDFLDNYLGVDRFVPAAGHARLEYSEHGRRKLAAFGADFTAVPRSVQLQWLFSVNSTLYGAAAKRVSPSLYVPKRLEAHVAPSWWLRSYTPQQTEAVRITADLLRAFQREVAADGGQLVLAAVPGHDQLRPGELMRAMGLGADRLDPERPQATLRAIAAREGIAFVDLLPAFRDADAAGRRVFWTSDPHWNEHGIDVAARVVARAIREAVVR